MKWVAAVVLLVLGVACEAPQPPDRALTFAIGQTAWSWPMYVGDKAGIYKKHGLDVRLKHANHPAGVAMLTSGEAQVNFLPLERALAVVCKDPSYVFVAAPSKRLLFAMVARAGVASVGDLRGRTIGVTQIGDSTHIYAVALLRRAGIQESDVQIIVVGPGRLAALAGGRVDAVMLGAPAYFDLAGAGHVIANIIDDEAIRAPTALLFERTWFESHQPVVSALMKAHDDAVRTFYSDQALAVGAYTAFDPDARDVPRTYQAYAERHAFEESPGITVEEMMALAPDGCGREGYRDLK